jgi:hypothetical protein
MIMSQIQRMRVPYIGISLQDNSTTFDKYCKEFSGNKAQMSVKDGDKKAVQLDVR